MVSMICKWVCPDVHLINIEFTLFQSSMGIFEMCTAQTERFDLGPQKDQSRFVGIFYKIVIPGFSVFRYNLFMRLFHAVLLHKYLFRKNIAVGILDQFHCIGGAGLF